MRIMDWSSDVCSSDLDFLNGGFRQTPIALRLLCAFRNCRQYCVGTTNQFFDTDFNYFALCRAAHFLFTFGFVHHERCFASARSEEHTSELQSLMRISYAVFCLKKNKKKKNYQSYHYNNQQQHKN